MVTAGCAVWLVSVAAPVASAQKPGGLSDADDKALSSYRLTTEKLDLFHAINKKLLAAKDSDPKLAAEVASQNALNYGKTLDETLAQFDAHAPHLAAAIKDGKMSNRDYVLTLFAVMMTETGRMIKEAAPDQPLPAEISADNVAFAEKNRTLFRDAFSDLDRLSARKKAASSDESSDN